MQNVRIAMAVLLCGCSLVNDPSAHTGGDGGYDAGPQDAGPPPIQGTEFCQRYAELVCDASSECCSTAPDPFDRTACITDISQMCREGFGTLILDPRTGYDAAAAGAVIEEGYAYVRGEGAHDVCDLDAIDWLVNRDGFMRVLSGTRSGGSICTPMSLVPFDYPALFSCSGSDLSCIAGSPDWVCQSRHTEGQSCALYWDCVDGMRCSPPLTGTCQTRLPNGQACNNGTDCESLVCTGEPGVCAPRTQDAIYCAFAPQIGD